MLLKVEASPIQNTHQKNIENKNRKKSFDSFGSYHSSDLSLNQDQGPQLLLNTIKKSNNFKNLRKIQPNLKEFISSSSNKFNNKKPSSPNNGYPESPFNLKTQNSNSIENNSNINTSGIKSVDATDRVSSSIVGSSSFYTQNQNDNTVQEDEFETPNGSLHTSMVEEETDENLQSINDEMNKLEDRDLLEMNTIHSIWSQKKKNHHLNGYIDNLKNSTTKIIPSDICRKEKTVEGYLEPKIKGFNPSMNKVSLLKQSQNFEVNFKKLIYLKACDKQVVIEPRLLIDIENKFQDRRGLSSLKSSILVKIEFKNVSKHFMSCLKFTCEETKGLSCFFVPNSAPQSKEGLKNFLRVGDFEEGDSLILALKISLNSTPFHYPRVRVEFNITLHDQPFMLKEHFSMPLFTQNFLMHEKIRNKEKFMYEWKMRKMTHYRFISDIFIAQHRLVKSDEALRLNFPSFLLLEKKQGFIYNKNDLTRLNFMIRKYGFSFKYGDEQSMMCLWVDNSDTCFFDLIIPKYSSFEVFELGKSIISDFIYVLKD